MMVFVLAGGIVVVLFCILLFLKRTVVKQHKEIISQIQDRDIIKMSPGANFFGQESLGRIQIRGNGTLILTENTLFFKLWMPQKKVFINISSIVELKIVASYLGKTKNCPLLKIIFINKDGGTDSIAFFVADTNDWRIEIEKLIKH